MAKAVVTEIQMHLEIEPFIRCPTDTLESYCYETDDQNHRGRRKDLVRAFPLSIACKRLTSPTWAPLHALRHECINEGTFPGR